MNKDGLLDVMATGLSKEGVLVLAIFTLIIPLSDFLTLPLSAPRFNPTPLQEP